jgi:hypothetical protein
MGIKFIKNTSKIHQKYIKYIQLSFNIIKKTSNIIKLIASWRNVEKWACGHVLGGTNGEMWTCGHVLGGTNGEMWTCRHVPLGTYSKAPIWNHHVPVGTYGMGITSSKNHHTFMKIYQISSNLFNHHLISSKRHQISSKP